MAIHDELLAKILAEPNDLASRLVYADALAEAGMTARAELIVVSCELARSPWGAIERPELHARCLELLRNHEAEWLAPLAKLGVVSAVFHDGLVEEVTVRASVFADHWGELFRLAPLRRVHLIGIEELRTRELGALLATPKLGELEGLGLRGATMHHGRIAAVFAAGSAATRVPSLDLSGTWWDLAALRTLEAMQPATAKHVTLSHVGGRYVGGTRRGPPRVVVGRILELLPNAEHVRMAGSARDIAQLVTTIPIAQIRSLDLEVEGTPLRANECTRLCSPRVKRLEELRLRGLESIEELIRWLPDAPFLQQLRVLELGDRGRWPGARVIGLVSLREASALERLCLSGVSLEGALPLIVGHPARATLRSLALDGCALDSASLEAIVRSEHLTELRRLDLRNQFVSIDLEARLRARFGRGVTIAYADAA
jgi:uncharacterized protein (TIGR02996 family)